MYVHTTTSCALTIGSKTNAVVRIVESLQLGERFHHFHVVFAPSRTSTVVFQQFVNAHDVVVYVRVLMLQQPSDSADSQAGHNIYRNRGKRGHSPQRVYLILRTDLICKDAS